MRLDADLSTLHEIIPRTLDRDRKLGDWPKGYKFHLNPIVRRIQILSFQGAIGCTAGQHLIIKALKSRKFDHNKLHGEREKFQNKSCMKRSLTVVWRCWRACIMVPFPSGTHDRKRKPSTWPSRDIMNEAQIGRRSDGDDWADLAEKGKSNCHCWFIMLEMKRCKSGSELQVEIVKCFWTT